MLRDLIHIWGTVFAGLLGLAFGSFLNVCLSRWPAGESIVKPRSHCRNCGHVLAWWENVPLVSWLLLRGRCRNCGAWIGWRYILVEAALGGLWAFAVWNSLPAAANGFLPSALLWYQAGEVACTMALIWVLVCLAALDAEYLWLPDWITWPGIVLGITLGILKLPVLVKLSARTGLPLAEEIENSRYGIYTPALELVLGAIAAASVVLLIRWIYWILRRREGIGLGDAKLMALLAAWLGFAGALLAFGIGVFLGAGMAIVVLMRPRKQGDDGWGLVKLPLGTFLCIGGIVSSLWGPQIIAVYMRWVGM
ncbi:MAG TPA: prepilin peptidase [Terracidiphilus sp.]|nr:prepilin peptidase [Terracidiphilus sp.]